MDKRNRLARALGARFGRTAAGASVEDVEGRLLGAARVGVLGWFADWQSGAPYCQPYCQPFRVLPAVFWPRGTWWACDVANKTGES